MTATATTGASATLDPASIIASLDEDQSLICVQTADSTALINAGAGSGKTRLVTAQVAYEIATNRCSPNQMMVITFTNRASRELRERTAQMIGPELASEMEYIGTFHSVCIKLLRTFGKKDIGWATFHIIDDDDQMKMLRGAAVALKTDPKKADLGTAKKMISLWKNRMVPPIVIMESAEKDNDRIKFAMGQLYDKYMELCRRARAMDFDDVLLYTVWALKKKGDMMEFCHNQFKRIYVDEYQDTNHVQSALVQLMRGPQSHVMAIGDDRQGIYSFRGANIENILNFTDQFPDAKIYNLARNYRSQSIIVEAAEEVIKNNKEQLPKECRAMNPRGDLIRLYSAFDDDEESDFVARSIEDLVTRTNHDYSDIAIIYRRNADSRQIETKLMGRKVPYVIIGGTHFYGRREVRDILAMIRSAVNPRDDAAVLRLLSLRPGVGQASIDAFIGFAADNRISLAEAMTSVRVRSGTARAQAQLLTEFFEEMQMAVMSLSLDEFIEMAQERYGYAEILENEYKDNDEDLLSRQQNIQELIRAAAQIQETEPGIMATVKLLDMAMQAEGEQKHEGVKLMTIHASKGLEFPIVFIVAFNEGIIPSARSNVAEERRLTYVAMTRAKEKLYVTYAMERYARGQNSAHDPSPFLEEIPEEFIRYER